MNLAGLRETGLLFVHRLGHQNAGVVFGEVEQQRRAVAHHRDKLLVAHPGGIEQDVVAQMADAVDHLAGVVDGAVVSAQLDNGEAERAFGIGTFGGDFADALANRRFVEIGRRNAAD